MLKIVVVVALSATGMNPESKPTLPVVVRIFTQGSAKVDWVTVWFLG
jgi:hypothetical protein